MKKRRTIKWWMIPLCILLAVVIFAAICWDSLVIYLAPKTVLTSALTNTSSLLQSRFAGSPALVLAKTLDIANGNKISLELDTANEFVGDIRYDMDLHIRHAPRQIYAEGSVATRNNSLDLSLYLDKDFAALSSKNLLQGNYYGITYDTFSQDIRKNSLLTFMVGKQTISQWEQSIDALRTQMSKETELPDISEEDASKLIMGILALKANVRKDKLELLRGEQECHVIRFQASGEQIQAGLNYAQAELPFPVSVDSVLVTDFYIVDNIVVRCSMELTGPDEEIALMITPDLKPEADSINILYLHNKEGTMAQFGATISTDCSDSSYADEISIGYTVNNIQQNYLLRYRWNHENGALQLELDTPDADRTLDCNLIETEDGFRIVTQNFESLTGLFTGKESKTASPCTMDVSKGATIETPEYKNFDQWSMEDLLVLLGSIGSMFGLGIQ